MASEIAGWGIGLPLQRHWHEYSPQIQERARYLLLDTLGAALAGGSAKSVRQVRTLVASDRQSAHDTALVLGTACQALDLDETNLPARCHIAAAIVPALAATALELRSTGAEFMCALLEAYEFEGLLGQSLAPRLGARGWHSSGPLGTLGAAYGAARLMRLDKNRTRNALAVAATQASGVKAVFGGTAKAFNFGRAAQSGVMAARLAQAGMTAPNDPFLSPDSFFAASGALPLQPLTEGSHPILLNHFKFLPYCIETHAAALAVRKYMDTHGRPARLQVYLAPTARVMVDKPAPADIDQARFSVQYVVASTLAGGARSPLPEGFRNDLFRNACVMELDEDPGLAHLGARVVGRTGTRDAVVEISLGDKGHLDKALLESKFELLVAPVLGPGHDRSRLDVLALADLDDVTPILGGCVAEILSQ